MGARMNEATVQRLSRLDREFYQEHAAEFSRLRQNAWPGWRRLLDFVRPLAAAAPAVLDAGSGNGRFARFLAAELGRPFRYLGLDRSEALLAEARGRCGALDGVEFRSADLLATAFDALPRFDLVSVLGVLHHVPGAATRQRLVAALADRVASGGLLALSFWEFGADPLYAERAIDVPAFSAAAGETLDPAELEPGDALLRFGSGGVRYCHFADEAEQDALAGSAGLELAAAFRSDGASGRGNRYLVLRRQMQ